MKHFHILRRVKLRDTKDVFMCADPECNWSRRKEFLLHKRFKCPYCGELYLTTTESLRLRIPHCHNCTAKKGIILTDPLVSKIVDDVIKTLPVSEVESKQPETYGGIDISSVTIDESIGE